MTEIPLPPALAAQPRLDTWIGFEDQGHVRVATGKVEIGQGVLTALAQIAAEELEVEPGRVRMFTARTDQSPNEGITAGSMSIETSGGALRIVASEIRSLFLAGAATRLSCAVDTLSLSDGRVLRDGRDTGLDYWRMKEGVDLSRPATGTVPPRTPAAYSIVGQVFPRIDLAERLTGAPFVHDLTLPAMVHARVLHRPWPGAVLSALDEAAIRRAGEGVEVIRIDDFLAVAAPDEFIATRAAAAAARAANWTGGTPWTAGDSDPRHLMTMGVEGKTAPRVGAPPAPATIIAHVDAEYSRPYISHASIGLCCAVAHMEGEALTVWSHTQGPYPLRSAIARMLGIAPDTITVIHMPGAGSYGHNGADDVAVDAALVARALPGRPVRMLWSRAQEIGASPVSTGQVVRLSADLSDDGMPDNWRYEVWSGPHARRPGIGPSMNLLAAKAIAGFPPDPDTQELPIGGGGGALRNAEALYDIPHQEMILHHVPHPPLFTSALRSLGAQANVLALESFMDELALAAGRDPVEYRLSLLSDPRARRVIETAAAMGGWSGREAGGEGRGLGFAFARYKNRGGYLAAVAEVFAEDAVRVSRLWLACDGGLIINPDGAINQIEGGAVQAVSITLKEAVAVAPEGVTTDSWATYPILRFSETPVIETVLVGDPTNPPLGLGEVSAGPVTAAVANAVAHALGVRIRDLPITRERILAALAR